LWRTEQLATRIVLCREPTFANYGKYEPPSGHTYSENASAIRSFAVSPGCRFLLVHVSVGAVDEFCHAFLYLMFGHSYGGDYCQL
jgi:hypothetical protein